MAGGVLFLQPFLLQKGFCLTAALLLAPKVRQRIPAVVPHLCGGAEAEFPTTFLQTPTHADVIASRSELRIKAIDRFECRSQEGHLPSGHALCFAITKYNIPGASS